MKTPVIPQSGSVRADLALASASSYRKEIPALFHMVRPLPPTAKPLPLALLTPHTCARLERPHVIQWQNHSCRHAEACPGSYGEPEIGPKCIQMLIAHMFSSLVTWTECSVTHPPKQTIRSSASESRTSSQRETASLSRSLRFISSVSSSKAVPPPSAHTFIHNIWFSHPLCLERSITDVILFVLHVNASKLSKNIKTYTSA